MSTRYAHTNIVALDWRRLAAFYQRVFACEPLPPERDYHGNWLRDVTTLSDERIAVKGMHLRLPGHGDAEPTLEIFQYHRTADADLLPAANRRGFAHIAFHVDDVDATREAVLAEGGTDLGKKHVMEVPGAGGIELIYMTDPEGNLVELQTWTKA